MSDEDANESAGRSERDRMAKLARELAEQAMFLALDVRGGANRDKIGARLEMVSSFHHELRALLDRSGFGEQDDDSREYWKNFEEVREELCLKCVFYREFSKET